MAAAGGDKIGTDLGGDDDLTIPVHKNSPPPLSSIRKNLSPPIIRQNEKLKRTNYLKWLNLYILILSNTQTQMTLRMPF